MTTTTAPTTTRPSPRHPAATATFGVVTYAAAMAAGEAFGLNADTGGNGASTGEWAVTGLIALAGVAIGVVVGLRGWAGSPTRLSRTALGLAIASAVLFIAFWSGWPSVFSAVAVGLAVEHRRRIGSFAPSSAVAAGLGTVAFVAMAFLCVTG
jgi:hypothetical protein